MTFLQIKTESLFFITAAEMYMYTVRGGSFKMMQACTVTLRVQDHLYIHESSINKIAEVNCFLHGVN